MDDVKKLTPEETVAALRHCVNDQHCTECVMHPHLSTGECTMKLCAAAADTIEFVQQGWIPVTDRLPDKELLEHQKQYEDEDLEVQVMIKGAKRPTTLFYNDEGEFYEMHADGATFYLVTHWAPLMEPPKEEHHEL